MSRGSSPAARAVSAVSLSVAGVLALAAGLALARARVSDLAGDWIADKATAALLTLAAGVVVGKALRRDDTKGAQAPGAGGGVPAGGEGGGGARGGGNAGSAGTGGQGGRGGQKNQRGERGETAADAAPAPSSPMSSSSGSAFAAWWFPAVLAASVVLWPLHAGVGVSSRLFESGLYASSHSPWSADRLFGSCVLAAAAVGGPAALAGPSAALAALRDARGARGVASRLALAAAALLAAAFLSRRFAPHALAQAAAWAAAAAGTANAVAGGGEDAEESERGESGQAGGGGKEGDEKGAPAPAGSARRRPASSSRRARRAPSARRPFAARVFVSAVEAERRRGRLRLLLLTVAFPALLALRAALAPGYGFGGVACADPETVEGYVEVPHAAHELPPARLLWRCRPTPLAPAVAVFEAALPTGERSYAFYRALAVGHSIVGGDFLLARRRGAAGWGDASEAGGALGDGSRGPSAGGSASAPGPLDESIYSTFYLQLAGLGLLEAASNVYATLGMERPEPVPAAAAPPSRPASASPSPPLRPASASPSPPSRPASASPSAPSELARYAPSAPQDVRTLVLGLGAGTVVSALSALGLSSDCLELHPEVLSAARAFFPAGFPAGTCVAGDARETVARLEPASYDLVVHDVCSGGLVPAPLVQAPFLARVGRATKPGGVLSLNHFGARSEAAEVAREVLRAGFSDPWVLEDDAPGDQDARNRVLLAVWLGGERADAAPGDAAAAPSSPADAATLRRAVEGLAARQSGILAAALRTLASRLAAARAPGGAARALRTAAGQLSSGAAAVGALAAARAPEAQSSSSGKLRAAVEHWNAMRFQAPDAIWNEA